MNGLAGTGVIERDAYRSSEMWIRYVSVNAREAFVKILLKISFRRVSVASTGWICKFLR